MASAVLQFLFEAIKKTMAEGGGEVASEAAKEGAKQSLAGAFDIDKVNAAKEAQTAADLAAGPEAVAAAGRASDAARGIPEIDLASSGGGGPDLGDMTAADAITNLANELVKGSTGIDIKSLVGGGARKRPRPTGDVTLAPKVEAPTRLPGSTGTARAPTAIDQVFADRYGAPDSLPGVQTTAAQRARGDVGMRDPRGFEHPRDLLAAYAIDRNDMTAPPGLDVSNIGPQNIAGATQTQEARHAIGLPSEYTRGTPEHFLVGAAKRAANRIPFVGEFVPDERGLGFKDLPMDEIMANPELRRRWEALTPEQRAFAMFDGSVKGAQALGAPPAVWDRMMGSQELTEKDGVTTLTERGGAFSRAGKELARVAAGGGGAGGGPGPASAASAGGRVITPRTQVGGTQARIGGGGGYGSRAGGEVGFGDVRRSTVSDTRPRNRYMVTQAFGPYQVGDEISRSDLQAAELIDRQLIRPMQSDADEIMLFGEVGPDGQLTGNTGQMTMANFRNQPELQAKWTPLDKETVTYVDSQGVTRTGSRTMAMLDSGLEAESKFVLKDYYDKENGRMIVQPTQKQLRESPGRYELVEERTKDVTKDQIARATDFLATAAQTKDLLDAAREFSPRSLAYPGRAGVGIHKMARAMGMEEFAEPLAAGLAGVKNNEALRAVAKFRERLKSWANQRKVEILNDQRISAVDQDRIDDLVSMAEAWVDPQQVQEIIVEFTGYAMINSELALAAAGQEPQFPVDTGEGVMYTMRRLIDLYGMTYEEAEEAAFRASAYPLLNPARYSGGQQSLEPQ